MRLLRAAVPLVIVLLGSAAPMRAQDGVTAADIERLQTGISDATRDVTQLRSRDAALASELQGQLDDLRDEVTALRVKLRKNEATSRSDYSDLHDRIERVRARARGDESAVPTPGSKSPAPPATPAPAGSKSSTGSAPRSSDRQIPSGTEMDVRLQQPLSSRTAQPEATFEATTVVDLRKEERVLIPAGTVVRGVVRAVNKAGRLDRKGSLDLAFDQITVAGRTYPMRATVTKAIESEGIRGDVPKIGVGAGVGAILGGILGGFKGALAGIVIGGGGVVAATEGQDVELPSGTVLRIRLDSGLTVD
jgi:hypothetical protein